MVSSSSVITYSLSWPFWFVGQHLLGSFDPEFINFACMTRKRSDNMWDGMQDVSLSTSICHLIQSSSSHSIIPVIFINIKSFSKMGSSPHTLHSNPRICLSPTALSSHPFCPNPNHSIPKLPIKQHQSPKAFSQLHLIPTLYSFLFPFPRETAETSESPP